MWTQADYNKWYSPVQARVPIGHPEHGNSFSYGWKYFMYGSRHPVGDAENLGFRDSFKWATSLVNRANYSPGTKALIVGCGIGQTVYKILSDYPSAKIWGTDTSEYIHNIKSVDSPAGFNTARIFNIDITASNALDLLKAQLGGNGKVDWIICETITETIPALDRPAWYAACEALLASNGKVAHLVYSNPDNSSAPQDWLDANWTWQSIDAWSFEQPNHYWIDASNTSLNYVPT